MTDLQSRLSKLKELVEKATPGPWYYNGYQSIETTALAADHPLVMVTEDDGTTFARIAHIEDNVDGPGDMCRLPEAACNAEFIAACDPDTVRELIQAAERGMEYERELAAIDALLERRLALDSFKTRYDKIRHALNTAAKAEPGRTL